MKVVVLGAAGGIGQPLSLLLKMQLPAGSELALYDPAPMTRGVAVDLSHIPSRVQVAGFTGRDPSAALTGADIAIITNPVNSVVPIAAEVLTQLGVYDPRRLFGLTSLDVARSESFCLDMNRDADAPAVPVIGGHSGLTIVPLFSHITDAHYTPEQLAALIARVQQAGTEVVEAKAGAGSATLAMAYAALRFCLSLVRAKQGEVDIREYAYIEGGHPQARFFSQPILLGPDGVAQVLDYAPVHPVEQAAIDGMLPTLNQEIQQGIDYARNVLQD